jgi:outer membrane lipoprotein SlyB
MVNGGVADYRIFAVTTTGFFGVENAAGELSVCRAGKTMVFPPSQAIALWSCVGNGNPSPAGEITLLQCRGLRLRELDVRGLSALRTLDCSENQLTELDLTGLTSLENLYCRGNPFPRLDLSPCPSLMFLGYSSRQLGYRDAENVSASEGVCNDGPLFSFLPKLDRGICNSANDTRCAEKYVSVRTRPASAGASRVREVAYALKASDPDAIATASPLLAGMIAGPCWLVPIPASNGSVVANLALARAIAGLVSGARVKIAINRTQPVESSTARRRRGELGLEVNEHHFIRAGGPINPLPLYFVDNVITTGNTIRAARKALGWGTGLAYADASSRFNTRLRRAAATVTTPSRSDCQPSVGQP